MFKRECDMYPAVQAWLQAKGFEVYTEIPHYCSCIDIVARHPETREIIVVEMKLGLTKKVIRQANLGAVAATIAYCAVASNPRKTGIDECGRVGIGLLRVEENGVREIVVPRKEGWVPAIEEMHKTLDVFEPGGVAGLPQQKGVGPAIDCAREVKKYFLENPRATWRQVFDEIENHYTSHQSMRGALVSRNLV